jgi:hypothetical protein
MDGVLLSEGRNWSPTVTNRTEQGGQKSKFKSVALGSEGKRQSRAIDPGDRQVVTADSWLGAAPNSTTFIY